MIDILINGKPNHAISISDRGLLYGDGLFETMAVRSGKIQLWEAHWQRFSLGCNKLSIELPSKATIENEIELLIESNNEIKFVIKLLVTRGEGKRGYRFAKEQITTRILSSHAWPNYLDKYQTNGVNVCYCETTLSESEKLAGIKHLNRLEQVLARNEWDEQFQEGLMSTVHGIVVDGTMSNVFAVQDKKIYTPKLSLCGVDGVMRKTIIKTAKDKGYSVYEKDFNKTELEQADELFLSNSLFGIWPIKTIGEKRFTKVGNVTKELQEEIYTICQ